jgi:predicted nucleotidyltransferase
VKRLVRSAVFATSFPPFLAAYRGAYGIVARLAVGLFRRYDAVKAIYLCRGSARGAIVPLVSDIDFVLIVEGLDARARADLLE